MSSLHRVLLATQRGYDGPSSVVMLMDIESRINLNDQDKVLAISALNFDLSVFDLFSTLHCGALL